MPQAFFRLQGQQANQHRQGHQERQSHRSTTRVTGFFLGNFIAEPAQADETEQGEGQYEPGVEKQ